MNASPKAGERKKAVPLARQLRDLRKAAADAVESLAKISEYMDATMRMPEGVERGRRIAYAANCIDWAKDSLWHFGLGNKLPVIRRKP